MGGYDAMIQDRRLLRCILLWVLLLPAFAGATAMAAAGPAAAQNPFGLDPKGAPATPGAAPERPFFRPPAAVQRFVMAVAYWQRQLNDELARQIAAYKSGGALAPVLAILLLSFLYGLFHAAGPGHGKFVVAAYFLANRARPRDGVLMSGLIALTQALVAIGLVGIFALALDAGTLELIGNVTWVELASYGLIVLLGLWMFWGGIVGRGCTHGHEPAEHHDHGHHDHGHSHSGRADPGLRAMIPAAVAAGLRPCTGAVIVLLFTLANGIFVVGVLGSLVMALGVAITVSTIGLAAIYTRRGAARAAGSRPGLARFGNLAHRTAGLAGGGVIVLVGVALALAAAEQLGFPA